MHSGVFSFKWDMLFLCARLRRLECLWMILAFSLVFRILFSYVRCDSSPNATESASQLFFLFAFPLFSLATLHAVFRLECFWEILLLLCVFLWLPFLPFPSHFLTAVLRLTCFWIFALCSWTFYTFDLTFPLSTALPNCSVDTFDVVAASWSLSLSSLISFCILTLHFLGPFHLVLL